MAQDRLEVAVGALVLAVAVGFAAFAARGTLWGGAAQSYDLRASFRSAEGVRVGTDVRLAGVKVGTVTALTLNPQTFFADATFSVAAGVAVPDDSTVLISSEGLLGGNFVEILPGGSPDNVPPGGEVIDTQGAVSLISLLLKFVGDGASDAVGGGAGEGG
jgi:phospholipid/cholesterol/gamma-HCH transport system substrate-binding protein